MNRAELRRSVAVALPCSIVVALAASAALTLAGTSPAGKPGIGEHWHASYQVWVCGVRQPNFPTWQGGVHTHADGIIHIHPLQEFEQGDGARLVKFFEYGGGLLTEAEMRMPGSSRTYRNGDECPDGSPGMLSVTVNDSPLDGWERYIPRDGDRIVVTFGTEP